jgi:hypothetical protein
VEEGLGNISLATNFSLSRDGNICCWVIAESDRQSVKSISAKNSFGKSTDDTTQKFVQFSNLRADNLTIYVQFDSNVTELHQIIHKNFIDTGDTISVQSIMIPLTIF